MVTLYRREVINLLKSYLTKPGNRNTGSTFNNRGSNLNLWSSSPSGSSAWRRNMNSSYSTVYRNTNSKANGFSVRCLLELVMV